MQKIQARFVNFFWLYLSFLFPFQRQSAIKGNHVLLFILFIFALVIQAIGSNEFGIPFIRYYPADEYRESPQNWDAVQDQRGVMYFGNTACILEYDGVIWRKIPLKNESRASALAMDRNGTIYVGGTDELGFLQCDDQGKIVFKSLLALLPADKKTFGTIWSIQATTHGIYFIGDSIIFRFFNRQIRIMSGFKRPEAMQHNDTIFLAHRHGISIIESEGIKPLIFFQNPLPNNFIMAPFDNDHIIIARNGPGLYLFNWKKFKEEKTNPLFSSQLPFGSQNLSLFPTQIDNYIKDQPISLIRKIHDHLFAFAVSNQGIIFLDHKGRCVQVVNKKRGLGNDSVSNLFKDRDENLWVTMDKGLAYIEINSPITQFNEFNGINDIPLTVKRYNKMLFAGTLNNLYSISTEAANDLKNPFVFKAFPKFNSGNCFELMPIDNRLLVAGKMALITPEDISQTISYLDLSTVLYFGKSQRFPNLIFLGLIDGLGVLEISEGNFLKKENFYHNGKYKAIKGMVKKIIDDEQGNLWVGTIYDGTYYVKFNGNNWKDVSIYSYGKDSGLKTPLWNAPQFIERTLYVATDEGIHQALFSADQNPMKTVFTLNNPINNVLQKHERRCREMVADNNKNIWVDAGLSISCLRKQPDGSYRWDPIQTKEIKGNSFQSVQWEANNILWVCTDKAIYRADLNIQKNYQSSFHTLIRQVWINNEIEKFSGTYFSESKEKLMFSGNISTIQPPSMIFTLPYPENSLTFEFAATFYEHTDETRFSYQLSGYKKEWSKWSSEAKAVFTNLSPGNYHFRVKSRNIFQHFGQTAFFQFSIAPPWYRTHWAYSLYILLLITLLNGFVRFNSRRLLAAKRKLETIIASRTAELVKQRDEIQGQKDEIVQQKSEIESYANQLLSTNQQLLETKNALWGEMELAKKIQTVLLPENPHIPGYEIAAYMNPADEVGGDYYDVIEVRSEEEKKVDGGWWLVDSKENSKEQSDREVITPSVKGTELNELNQKNPKMNTQNVPASRELTIHFPPDVGYPFRDYPLTTNHQSFIPPESKDKAGFIPVGPTTASEPSYWLSIGDVSGHGVPAGLIMMMVQTSIRSVLEGFANASPKKILQMVNSVIYNNIQKLGEDKYMTITLMSIQPNGKIFYSGLHQDIMIYRADKKEVEFIETAGMWIGLLDDIKEQLNVKQLNLNPNDVILLYTDGLSEAIDQQGTMYSSEKLAQVLNRLGHLSSQKIKAGIVESLQNYSCEDDVTLLILKRCQ